MEKFLQIAPHSLAIVLSPVGEASGSPQPTPPAPPQQLARHHIGYEIFADFKAENMQHFWNKKVTAAVAETFFLGWIDEQVLLIQGKEEHLEALREGWTRRALRPPSGFQIRCLGESAHPPGPLCTSAVCTLPALAGAHPGGFAPCLACGNPHMAALPGGAVPGGDCQVRGARARAGVGVVAGGWRGAVKALFCSPKARTLWVRQPTRVEKRPQSAPGPVQVRVSPKPDAPSGPLHSGTPARALWTRWSLLRPPGVVEFYARVGVSGGRFRVLGSPDRGCGGVCALKGRRDSGESEASCMPEPNRALCVGARVRVA